MNPVDAISRPWRSRSRVIPQNLQIIQAPPTGISKIVPIPTAVTLASQRIKSAWAKYQTYNLEFAREVWQVWNSLEHGQWTALFRDADAPFRLRTGQRLVRIWKVMGPLNTTALSRLPMGLWSLYQLCRLGRPRLLDLIDNQIIVPRLTPREVDALVRKFLGLKAPTASFDRRLKNACTLVEEILLQWPRKRKRVEASLTKALHSKKPPLPSTNKSENPIAERAKL